MSDTTKCCSGQTREVDHEAPAIFGTTALVPCGKPAEWLVEAANGDWYACESCATDALMFRHDPVSDRNGDRVALDADGEMVAA
jgi:hypothetical protein